MSDEAVRREAVGIEQLAHESRERWGDDAALSWHPDTGMWSAHHRAYFANDRVLVERLTEAEALLGEAIGYLAHYETPLPQRLCAAHDAYRAKHPREAT